MRTANPFENALAQISRADAVRPFAPAFLEALRHPKREIRVAIPVMMDDDGQRIFEGYRVQHDNARGPYKGGIRFHQDTDMDEVRALALWMTMKCSLAGLPMGGGKGGVTVDPKTLSKGELERLSRGFVRALVDVLGPKKDVPAPDVNTTPEIMAWMADEYGRLTGDRSGAVITGKPLDKGGSEGRGKATALGGFYVFETLRARLALPERCHVVIQGFGNAGRHAAELWAAAGHRVVAVSDSHGGIHDENGLDVAAVGAHKDATGSVAGFPGARTLTNEALLEIACDLLIPAALENQISAGNAGRIKATAVLELANGPTTPEADDMLHAAGVHVVPDILANAGGVTVSTFEWEQNLKGERWSEEEVLERLSVNIRAQAEATWNRAKELRTDLRRAAFILALERLEAARAHAEEKLAAARETVAA